MGSTVIDFSKRRGGGGGAAGLMMIAPNSSARKGGWGRVWLNLREKVGNADYGRMVQPSLTRQHA